MWNDVVGQARATQLLQRAAQRPGHAYLIAGPRGSGAEELVRRFAAELVVGDGDENARRRVLFGRHPDVIEFEPTGTWYSIEDDVRRGIIAEASRSPIEGDRKVIVIFDAERLRDDSANALLKTIEEPPPSTVVVLVTESADDLLETVQSRCQRVDMDALSAELVSDALVKDGVDQARAELVAKLGGGRLDRSRRLTGRFARLRDTFVLGVSRLDGSAAAALMVAEEMDVAIQDAVAALRTAHEQELEKLEAELEAAGYADRTAQAVRRRTQERHKREDRRARLDALLEGITALETMYRDALAAPAPSLNSDRAVLIVSPADAAAALERCQAAHDALEFNPNEALLLENLVMHLPASRR